MLRTGKDLEACLQCQAKMGRLSEVNDRQADRGRQVDRGGENRVWEEKRQKRTVLGGQRVIGDGLTDRGLDLQWGRKINVNT